MDMNQLSSTDSTSEVPNELVEPISVLLPYAVEPNLPKGGMNLQNGPRISYIALYEPLRQLRPLLMGISVNSAFSFIWKTRLPRFDPKNMAIFCGTRNIDHFLRPIFALRTSIFLAKSGFPGATRHCACVLESGERPEFKSTGKFYRCSAESRLIVVSKISRNAEVENQTKKWNNL